MIQLTENLWIGDSADEGWADVVTLGINGILNVAQDLQATRGWMHAVEYMQVGLIDGPGNPPSAYCAAVLALATLMHRGHTLVVCHTGGRALAVALIYLNVGYRRDWDALVGLVRERVDVELPVPNTVHRAAFDKMDWRVLAKLMESK